MNGARDFDLSTLLAEVRRRALLVALCTLAAAGAAYAASQQLGDRYEASAELLFQEANPNAPERTAATNLALASLDSVVFRVRKRLGTDVPVDTLRKQISLEPRGQADIVKVTAHAGTAKEAARLANIFAEEVVNMRRDRAQLAVQRQIDVLDARIVEAAADPAAVGSLNQRRQKLAVDKALATGDVEIADPALPPLERSSPKPLRYALVSAFLAFLLATAAVVLVRTVQRRVDEKDVSGIFGAPILARVPTRRRSAWREQLYQEAFQFLRANVATVIRAPSNSKESGGGRGRMIAVTSPLPGNGKSTVVAGLSDALALAGSTVLAVDCDLRKPTLTEEFGLLPGTDGLPEALLGHYAAEDLLVSTSIPSVTLLPGGQAGANFAVAHARARTSCSSTPRRWRSPLRPRS
jgi:succinoglycan biosynthesis transport protein ExoP